MWRSLPQIVFALLFISSLVAFPVMDARAGTVRYFGVWSYLENAPLEPLSVDAVAQRELGYWGLDFEPDGTVKGGTYYGASGGPWLRIRYARDDGKIYAEVLGPDGELRTRKSTNLSDLKPVGLD